MREKSVINGEIKNHSTPTNSTYSVLKSTLESGLLALCTDIMVKDIFQSIMIKV